MMLIDNPAHPAKDQLIAFGQGKLAADESSQVEEHLEVCPECCETLLDLKDDTFVGLVRIAKPDAARAEAVRLRTENATEAKHGGVDSEHAPTLLVQSGETIAASELPVELRGHPRYRIVELIGRGGMGNVYRAEHRLMNRAVAIKLINSQLMAHPHAVERFRREVQAAAKLSHPNIVAAYDAEQAGSAHFLVMEFIEGTDLASVVKQRGPMSVAEACECIRQAADGLQHAHEKGMVHRDIKPHNLMMSRGEASGGSLPGSRLSSLDSRPLIRILDFGLAGFAEAAVGWVEERDLPSDGVVLGGSRSSTHPTATAAHLTTIGSVMGTPDYMAPEQAADAHSADIRADIYSLGCTLHFLLTGKPLFEADNVLMKLKAHAQEPPPSLTTLRKDVPAELAKVVSRMMAKNPAERFQAPAEVAEALMPFVQPAIVPPKRRGRTLIATALLGVTVLLAGIIYVQTDQGQFVIETADKQVAVMLGEQEIKIRDAATNRELSFKPGKHPIRTGEYLMDVSELPSGLEFSVPKFTLKRGKEERVTVRLKSKSDQERLQGQWQPVAAEVMGIAVPEALIQTIAPTLTFKGDNVTWHAGANSPLAKLNMNGVFHLDPSKTPKTIDIVYLGENAKTLLGIYQLENDLLKLCMFVNPDRSEARPTEFATKPGNKDGAQPSLPDFNSPDFFKNPGSMMGLVTLKRAAVKPEERIAAPAASTTRSDSPLASFRDSAAVLMYLNNPLNNRGGSVPIALLGQAGRVAFRFGNWLVVFEGIVCDPKIGLLGFSGFNVPQAGSSGTGTMDFGAGDKLPGVLIKFKLQEDFNELSINNHRFKLRGKATQLEFDDKTYDTTNSLQTILVARDGSTRLVEQENPNAIVDAGRFTGHEGAVSDAVVSPGGRYGISCGADKTIRVWDLVTQEEKRVLKGHEGSVFGLAVSRDGKLLASGDKAKSIRLWNLETGEQVGELTGHTEAVTNVAFMPDRTHLLSAGFDGTLRLWHVADRKLVRTIDLDTIVEKMLPLPDGRRVMLSGAHTRGWGPITYDLEKGEKIDATPNAYSCMAVSADGRMLLIGSITGVLVVRDTVNDNVIVQMTDPRTKGARDAAARDAAITPDGRFVITTTREKQMHLWDLHQGKLLSTAEADTIGTISLSPDGRFALTIGREGGVGVWRLPESVLEPIAVVPASARANLLTDPSFENTPLTQLPRDWRAWLNDGTEFRCEVVAGGHTGQRCLKISGKGTRGVVFANDMKADRSKRYALKGWTKFEGDKDARAIIKFNYFRGSEFLGVHDLVGVTADQPDWHLLEKTDALDVYPQADHFYAMCHVEGSGTGWFDDLELIAYDRDKLPIDFDSRHGRNNRLRGPNSLNRWVGIWETEYAFHDPDNSPRETKRTMQTVSEKTLGDYFLLSHSQAAIESSKRETPPPVDLPANIAAVGRSERLLFLTFDQNLGAFRQWIFSGTGKAYESRGPWNDAAQTLELRMLPDASNMFTSERFVSADRVEIKLRQQFVMGSREVGGWTTTRKAATAKVDVPATKSHVAEPEELSLLNKFVGDWTIHAKSKPSVWVPNGDEETQTEKVAWILGGRFLMARTFNEKDELTSMWIATYEPSEKSNRFWFFSANGSSGEWRVTWDASSRGFHWRPIDMPTGWIGTGFNRWIDDDTFDNAAMIKDENGRVLLDGTQDKRRKK